MKLSSQQVKDMLHIGNGSFMKLIESGKLIPVNKPKENAKKFFRKFDSVAVNKLRIELKNDIKPSHNNVKIVIEKNEPNGILTRLDRIESKLQKLIDMWS